MTYFQSNDEGEFEFKDLQYGTYKLRVDIAGKDSEIASIDLNEANPDGSASFVIEGNAIVLSVEQIPGVMASIGQIYPNPVNGNAAMEIAVAKKCEIAISLINQMGKTVSQFAINLSAGKQIIPIDVSDLKVGFYNLRIMTEDGQQISRKFIKM